MTLSPVAGLLLLLAASTPVGTALDGPPPPAAPDEGTRFAQLTFHSRVVIRVESSRKPIKLRDPFREKKGPRCVDLDQVAGAAVMMPGSVDLVTRGGGRVRARFAATCPALDYYSGFYIVPNRDARICAGRDVVRDRAGGECGIDKFRQLEPRK